MLEQLFVYYLVSIALSVRLRVMSGLSIEFGSGQRLIILVIRYVLTTEATWVIIVTTIVILSVTPRFSDIKNLI